MPRFEAQAPLDVTVVRSGIPDTLPGRALNVCERGFAAVLAGELAAGEVVRVEIRLPSEADTLRTRAMVRHQDKLRCGMEFVGLTAEQRGTIREWSKEAKAEPSATADVSSSRWSRPIRTEGRAAKIDIPRSGVLERDVLNSDGLSTPIAGNARKSSRTDAGNDSANYGDYGKKRRRLGRDILLILLLIAAFAATAFRWGWDRQWAELESQLKIHQPALAEKPQVKVPAEVMEKLLVHRVQPEYPAEARNENLQGVIALDIVVGRDGSVLTMRALNGPDVLARAAMDALRWWKFAPYPVNGKPAVVETTVAVEFKQ